MLVLGLDSSTQSLTAVVLDAASGRVVHQRALNFDKDLPLYGTRNGVLPNAESIVVDLRRTDWAEPAVNAHLERHGILGNTTTLPRRPGDRSSLGLRLGSTPMSIRGLPADTYVLRARMDVLGHGARNAGDPTGNTTSFAVSADVTGRIVALNDPTTPTPTTR